MRAEDTLQYMADFYPDLFPTRKHALDHLFCTVGNGYDWIDGELVDTDDDGFEKRYRLVEHIEKAEFRHEDSWNHEHERWKQLHELCDMNIPTRYQFEWYPLSKRFSNLYTAPHDIKPDWKLLLDECKQLLIEDGIGV